MIDRKELTKLFDHSLLRANATREEFDKLCREALANDFMMVAVNSGPVKLCAQLLKGSDVKVGAAIGFPLGQTTISAKLFETSQAIEDGAEEIDYVVNLTELKAANWLYVEEEMQSITELCRQNKIIVKVIFENFYLSQKEIVKLCETALKVKPDFVKTSTGFAAGGARVEDVRLMSDIVAGVCQVKAAGQIRDWATCQKMLEAGATRIGTSSSLEILAAYDRENS